MLIEDNNEEFLGNTNGKWYCMKASFNDFVLSLLHPVSFKTNPLCKLPSHAFGNTYDVILISEVDSVKRRCIMLFVHF